jgi:hypothetical protein
LVGVTVYAPGASAVKEYAPDPLVVAVAEAAPESVTVVPDAAAPLTVPVMLSAPTEEKFAVAFAPFTVVDWLAGVNA